MWGSEQVQANWRRISGTQLWPIIIHKHNCSLATAQAKRGRGRKAAEQLGQERERLQGELRVAQQEIQRLPSDVAAGEKHLDDWDEHTWKSHSNLRATTPDVSWYSGGTTTVQQRYSDASDAMVSRHYNDFTAMVHV